MHVIKYNGLALCSQIQLFRLINQVEHYPQFLSWCKNVTIHTRQPTILQATALISKYGISFHCPFNYTLQSKNEISVGLPSGGPFHSVVGLWQLQGTNNETAFSFELQLDYRKTWWVSYFAIPIIKNEVKNLIKSFEQRAKYLKS